MKDKLKRFVRDNREAFDGVEPSDELWNKISERLPEPIFHIGEAEVKQVIHKNFQNGGQLSKISTVFSVLGNWKVAAAIILGLGLSFMVYQLDNKYQLTEQPEIVMTSPALAKQVSQYTQLVDDKRVELRNMTKSDPELYKQFAKELDQLELSYQNLKADLPENPNQETLIEAMIQNLQLQIDILNQQLQIIQKIKQSKNNEKHTQNIV